MTNETDIRLALANEFVKDQWTYAALGIVDDVAVTLKAATSGKRNCLSSLQIDNPTGTITRVKILDGDTTVLWEGVAASNSTYPRDIIFPIPLIGTLNTALKVKAVTATGGVGVFVNAQGYQK